MAGMIVCDDVKRITHMDIGWPGCVNDKRVWNNSVFVQNPSDYFDVHEYLLADSGYANQLHLIPSYRKVRGFALNASQELFNKAASKCRNVVENCIGILKGRFQFLRGMRIDISTRRGAQLMLHNLSLDDTNEWETELHDIDMTNSHIDNSSNGSIINDVSSVLIGNQRDGIAAMLWEHAMDE